MAGALRVHFERQPSKDMDENCNYRFECSTKHPTELPSFDGIRSSKTSANVQEQISTMDGEVVKLRNSGVVFEIYQGLLNGEIVTGVESSRKLIKHQAIPTNDTAPVSYNRDVILPRTLKNIDYCFKSYAKNGKTGVKYETQMPGILKAIECFHAQDYNTMITMLTCRKPQRYEDILLSKFGCGLAYYKLAKISSATGYFKECMELAQSYHSTADISLVCVYLGDISSMDNDYIRAAGYYFEAVKNHGTGIMGEMFKLVMPTMSALYTKQGAALRQASQMAKAVEAFRLAIGAAECAKDRMSAHNSLGNLLQSLGDHAGALEEYKVCISLGEELKDYISLGWTHGNMGNTYLGLHEKDKALHYLKKSLDLVLIHEPTPAAICRAYNNLGTAYQALNELDLAEENYKLARDQAAYGNDKAGEGRALGNLGNLFLLRMDYPHAIESSPTVQGKICHNYSVP